MSYRHKHFGILDPWKYVHVVYFSHISSIFNNSILHRSNEKKPKLITISSVVSMIILTLCIRFSQLNDTYGHLLIFFARVPIFTIGLNIGRLVYEHVEIEKINYIKYIY